MKSSKIPKDNGLPKRKFRYRFACFASPGDKDIINEPPDNFLADPIKIDEEANEKANKIEIKEVPYEDLGNANYSNLSLEQIKLQEEEKRKKDEERIKIEEEKRKLEEEEAKRLEIERLINTGYKSKDGNDPFIYSEVLSVSPKSFINYTIPYDKTAPPPIYLTEEEMYRCTKTKKEDILEGLICPPEGGLVCVNQEILKRQSGILGDMLMQFITKMSAERVSLPVRIFEPRSTIDRIADFWRFAPHYLTNGAKSRDKIERFKHVIAFSMAGVYSFAGQLKPFNPLIGETLQGGYSDGTKVYIEHTSHHPNISNFLLIGPNACYRMYGHYEYKVQMDANSMEGQQIGPNNVEFANGQKVVFRYPKMKMYGLIVGRRIVYPSGNMTYEDEKNGIKAVIIFNYGKARGLFGSRVPDTKIDDVEGLIYYARKGVKQTKPIERIRDIMDVEMPIGNISGSWLKNMKLCGSIFWDIDKVEAFPLIYDNDALTCDWRFREDLIWLRRGNHDYAQEWKLKIEQQQRSDEKLRAATRSKMKH